MALNTRLAVAAQNVQLNALAPLANTGYIKIYDGSQPATGDTAITTQNLLATLRFGATAFGAASAGVITANSIANVTITATGTAAWFRILESDNSTPLWDGSVGTSGTNMVLGSVAFSAGALVSITALTHTLPMQGA